MAIYSFRGQYVGLTHKLQNCVAAAAYRAGAKLEDPRSSYVLGTEPFASSVELVVTHDYTRDRERVVHSEILVPEGAPSWMSDRQQLWSSIQKANNRKAGVTAREIRIALPKELTREQNVALMRGFLQEEFVRRGIVVDWNFHDANDGNPHVHLMLSTRAIDASKKHGWGNKVRAWDDRALYMHWREQWAVHANRSLELAGHEERIDHRSYKEREIDLAPEAKLYRKPADAELDQSESTQARVEERNERKFENGLRIQQDPRHALKLLTHQRATFKQEHIVKLATTHSIDDAQRDACVAAIMASPDLIEVAPGRYTSREMRDAELRLLEAASALHTAKSHQVEAKHVERAITRAEAGLRREAAERGGPAPSVSDEQRRAIEHVTTSTGAMALLEGHAGTGKSFLLGAAREAWEAQGLTVVGGALAGKAADGLSSSSGIESRTLHSWERSWSLEVDQLTPQHVLVIDEAGMLGTRQLGRVIETAREAGAKVVLVGDSGQLQAIEAGSPFRVLCKKLGTETLTEIRRQRVDWQREAAMAFADKRPREALEAYQAHDLVKAHKTTEGARAAVVKAWAKGLDETALEKQLMFAYRRDDVRELNVAARAVRRERGELGEDVKLQTEYGERAFARGDRVYFGRNDRGLDVKNGTLGTIDKVDRYAMTVRLDGDESRAVRVHLRDYAYVDHAYAVTVHKSQGATLERSYVLGSQLFDASTSYVSMSRHRAHGEVHWARDEFGNRARFMQAMTRDRPKELAHELLEQQQALHKLLADREATLKDALEHEGLFELCAPDVQRRLIAEYEREATLKDALEHEGLFELCAPDVQRRLIAEYEREYQELDKHTRPLVEVDWVVRERPDVQEALRAKQVADQRLGSARFALENFERLSWGQKMMSPDSEASLHHRLKAAETAYDKARTEHEKLVKKVTPLEREKLGAANSRAGKAFQRLDSWRKHVLETERLAFREAYAERVAEKFVGQEVRWGSEKDQGVTMEVITTGTVKTKEPGKDVHVALMRTPKGDVLLHEVSAYDLKYTLKKGVRVQFSLEEKAYQHGHELKLKTEAELFLAKGRGMGFNR